MKIRSHIRSVRLVFSIFLLLILAGLTGCKEDGTEFLEKELVQEESTETSGMDAEQEDPKDTESEVSGKESAGDAADISQKKQNESAEEQAPEVEKQLPEISDTPQTIYVDICGAVTSPGVYELPYGSRVFQAIEQAGGYRPEAAASYLNRAKGLSDGQQIYVPTQAEVDSQRIAATQDGSEVTAENSTEKASGQKSAGVLVVDDEKLIVKGLRFSLEQDGMEVDCAYDGEEALEKAKAGEYDIILLDLMLPKMDGLEVCQQIREFSNVPIIMLTAKGEDMDKILGLEYGADDYVTKPFNILEVKARIKAIIRRAGSKQDKQEKAKTVEVGELKLDCEGRRVFISGKEINLTAKEFDVLELLVFNPNKVYSRENLLNIVWGYEYPGDVRTVDVHIRRLREKIEANPSEPKYVHTKWGVGYYFQA